MNMSQTPLSSSDSKRDAMCAVLAQNWWAVALRGLLGIVFGLIALFVPGATMLSLVLFFSAYMLVDGLFTIIAAVRAARQGERWGFLVLEGIVNAAVAAVAAIWPGLTLIAFILMIAAWALVSGGFMLAAAFRLKQDHGRGWLAFGGAVSIIYGGLLIVAPLVGAVVLTWWLGAYALVFGVALVVAALKLRARRDEPPSMAVTRKR